jgi:general secretion pathway protein G
MKCNAFTLVEILIVVMILGILAAIAIPKLSNASQVSRESAMKDDLRLLRTQIGVYKSQHFLHPGYPGGDGTATPTAQASYDQLTKYTDAQGNTSASSSPVYRYGPYITMLPSNPINGNSDWKILAPGDAFVTDNTTGWLYQPSSGTIRANSPGNDSEGKPIVEY